MNKKLTVIVLAAVICGSVFSQAKDAASIVELSRNRINAATVSTRSRMIVTSKSGAASERVMDQYSKDNSAGSGRSVVVFQSPASVAGTRFLTIENQGRSNDQWIFLPSLGKVRRIAASEGSGSFVGTDFSYDDISSQDREPSLDNHKILREETFNGADCYVIESVPKDTSYQYSKMVQYIDKQNFVNYKVELYDKKGVQVKLLEVSEYREVQGRLSSMVTKMTTIAAGTSTTLNVDILKYDDPIPEQVFTPVYLETGRAR